MESDSIFSREKTARSQKIDVLLAPQEDVKKTPGEFLTTEEYLDSVDDLYKENPEQVHYQWDETLYGGEQPDNIGDILRTWQEKDRAYIKKKQKRIERSKDTSESGMLQSEIEALLESSLNFAINHGEVFGQDAFAEHGSQFDDFKHGADVIIGFRDPNGIDNLFFSADAFAGTSPEKVDEKFANRDSKAISHPYAPLCTSAKYLRFEDADGNIRYKNGGIVPNYIIGISKINVLEYIDDHIDIKYQGGNEPLLVSGNPEQAANLRNKILVQIYLQSFTGYSEAFCYTNRPPKEATKDQLAIAEDVKYTHKKIFDETTKTLMTVFGINPEAKDATTQVEKMVFKFINDENFRGKKDESFLQVVRKSVEERNKAIKKAKIISAQNAARAAQNAAKINIDA